LIATGRDLLRRFSFTKKTDQEHWIGDIARACLVGEEGMLVAQETCANLKDAVATHGTLAFYHYQLLRGLFVVQPIASLNALCKGDEEDLARGVLILRDVRSRQDLISLIPEEELLRWCDEQPDTRYPAIAGVLPISCPTRDTDAVCWTAIALEFLERAPDPASVLKEYVNQFLLPGGSSGSLAATLEAHAALLDQLGGSARLAEAVVLQKRRMLNAIERERRRELADSRERDERFE
jgi:hypothetical protein